MSRLSEKRKETVGSVTTYFVLGIVLVLFWLLISKLGDYPEFIFPGPIVVTRRFWDTLRNGQLIFHLGVTLIEVIIGLGCGTVFAVVVAYLLAKSILIKKYLSPVLVASQAIPIVAVAPLLVIWFGPGLFSKILVCSIIIFFPVLVNTLAGLESISKEHIDLLTTFNTSSYVKLKKLEIPASLPSFFTGLRVGATLSVTGAVVGEFIGADKGLGFLLNVARGQYDTALVIVIIFVLVFLALSLYHLVLGLESLILKWKD